MSQVASAVADVSFEDVTTKASDEKEDQEEDSNQRTAQDIYDFEDEYCEDEHQVIWQYEDEFEPYVSYESYFDADGNPVTDCDYYDLEA